MDAESTPEGLDSYEYSLGLRPIRPETESEAFRIVDLPPAAVRALPPDEAVDAAYVLRQFALHLQRAMNREQSEVRRGEENLRAMLSAKMAGLPGYSYDERRGLAISRTPAAAEVDARRVAAQLRLDRVSFLHGKVSDMARTLEAKGSRPQRKTHESDR